MEMKQLTFFKLTAELEHMTQAADQLLVAQPFLSKTISALESELGVELFDHVGRKIQLNNYGKAFYRRVERVLSELEDAKRELDDMARLSDRSVSLVTNTSLYMPNLLSQFRLLAPEVNLHQASARRLRILKMLQAGDVDFAICTPPITEEPELETVTLIYEDCPVIYPPEHWLKWRTDVNLKDLAEESFISAAPGYGIRDLAESFFNQADIHPSIIVESTDTSTIPNFVKSGLGIAFSPLTSVLRDPVLRDCHVKITDPPCIGIVGLTWKKDRYQSKAANLFRKFAVEHFATLSSAK